MQSKMQIKGVFVGDSTVGKTCLPLRYTTGLFPSDNKIPTVLNVMYTANVIVDGGTPIRLEVWDTSGMLYIYQSSLY